MILLSFLISLVFPAKLWAFIKVWHALALFHFRLTLSVLWTKKY